MFEVRENHIAINKLFKDFIKKRSKFIKRSMLFDNSPNATHFLYSCVPVSESEQSCDFVSAGFSDIWFVARHQRQPKFDAL